jgi:hypothetical protein
MPSVPTSPNQPDPPTELQFKTIYEQKRGGLTGIVAGLLIATGLGDKSGGPTMGLRARRRAPGEAARGSELPLEETR